MKYYPAYRIIKDGKDIDSDYLSTGKDTEMEAQEEIDIFLNFAKNGGMEEGIDVLTWIDAY